jgi:hypothetical protein
MFGLCTKKIISKEVKHPIMSTVKYEAGEMARVVWFLEHKSKPSSRIEIEHYRQLVMTCEYVMREVWYNV